MPLPKPMLNFNFEGHGNKRQSLSLLRWMCLSCLPVGLSLRPHSRSCLNDKAKYTERWAEAVALRID